MTTQVAPAAMSTAWLARPLRSMVPTVNTAPAAWASARGQRVGGAFEHESVPDDEAMPAQNISWAMRATGRGRRPAGRPCPRRSGPARDMPRKMSWTARLTEEERRSNPRGSRGSTMVNRTLADVTQDDHEPDGEEEVVHGAVRIRTYTVTREHTPPSPRAGSGSTMSDICAMVRPWRAPRRDGGPARQRTGSAGLRSKRSSPAGWSRRPSRVRLVHPRNDRGAVSDVIDLPEQGRFELDADGHAAELVYRVVGDRLVLIHTEVPVALGGRGIGGRLVQAAVERAAADGLTIVPRCPFARRGWSVTPTRRHRSRRLGARSVAEPAAVVRAAPSARSEPVCTSGNGPWRPAGTTRRRGPVEPVLYLGRRHPGAVRPMAVQLYPASPQHETESSRGIHHGPTSDRRSSPHPDREAQRVDVRIPRRRTARQRPGRAGQEGRGRPR